MALTLDRKTIDSAGVFLVGELDRLDSRLYVPLVDTAWSRDIDVRTDVSISDETTSYILSTYGVTGGVTPTGKNWLNPEVTAIPGVSVDGARHTTPLYPWALELSYDAIELARSMRLNRPLDAQKLTGLNLKHQMDVDEMVYVGDTEVAATGLLNSPVVTIIPASTKAGGGTAWANATPDEILADVNLLLTTAWQNSGYTIAPSKLILPAQQYGVLVSRKVSDAGNVSVLQYVLENSIATRINGRPLDIQPSKWNAGAGAGNTDRAAAYTQNEEYLRFPYVPLIRSPQYQIQLRTGVVYYGLLGEVEIPRPETILYMDGI